MRVGDVVNYREVHSSYTLECLKRVEVVKEGTGAFKVQGVDKFFSCSELNEYGVTRNGVAFVRLFDIKGV